MVPLRGGALTYSHARTPQHYTWRSVPGRHSQPHFPLPAKNPKPRVQCWRVDRKFACVLFACATLCPGSRLCDYMLCVCVCVRRTRHCRTFVVWMVRADSRASGWCSCAKHLYIFIAQFCAHNIFMCLLRMLTQIHRELLSVSAFLVAPFKQIVCEHMNTDCVNEAHKLYSYCWNIHTHEHIVVKVVQHFTSRRRVEITSTNFHQQHCVATTALV